MTRYGAWDYVAQCGACGYARQECHCPELVDTLRAQNTRLLAYVRAHEKLLAEVDWLPNASTRAILAANDAGLTLIAHGDIEKSESRWATDEFSTS